MFLSTPMQYFGKTVAAIPTRFNVAFMLFNSCLVAYMMRVLLSISILAMVEPNVIIENNSENDTTKSASLVEAVPDYGPRYNWSPYEESLVLGSFFYGYLCTQLLGGMLAEAFGGRIIIFLSLFFSAMFTGLSPLMADFGIWYFVATRVAIGIACGILYPAIHCVVALWSPVEEKGKFVACLLGGALGTVITWSMVGYIIETFGWIWSFYIPAVITAVFAFIWLYLVSDSPQNHPRISDNERMFIQKSQEGRVSNKKAWMPVKHVLTSIPFWALIILHFGNNWGLYFLLTAAPKFMSEVLGFKLSKAGYLAALPYLARLLSGFVFGSVGDYVRSKKIMSVTANRKFFVIFSHIIPGLFLTGLCFVQGYPYVAVTLVTLSLGFNGSATLTNLQNAQDLSPNYAGSLYGIANFFGTTSGFLSPMVVAHFTAEQSTFEQWSKIFWIGGGVYIIPAIIFMIFGSGEVQKWNDLSESREKDKKIIERYTKTV
ncbi:sialin-like [Culicoides brevitarsis]|uniref:sialin-like n=1 Tax=Culicoides brevitarsis TaxID=469753 RepID=UPI00307C7997